jgi:hypothetical protein
MLRANSSLRISPIKSNVRALSLLPNCLKIRQLERALKTQKNHFFFEEVFFFALVFFLAGAFAAF